MRIVPNSNNNSLDHRKAGAILKKKESRTFLKFHPRTRTLVLGSMMSSSFENIGGQDSNAPVEATLINRTNGN